jgi:excisionase family DNA binding protein
MSSDVLRRSLLPLCEVADELAVSERTVRRLIGRGELPALRVGGQIRVERSELDAWIYSPELRSMPDDGEAA